MAESKEVMSSQELNLAIQQRLMEELADSEKRYRELVERIREVVFKCDGNGKISFLNRAWTDILGYPVKESVGRFFRDFLFEADSQEAMHLITKSLKGDANGQSKEVRLVRSDGTAIWLMLSVHSGETEGKVGSLHNIDARKRMEEERKKAQKELQHAFVKLKETQDNLFQAERLAVIGETSGRVAHEILNPITSILSRVEINISQSPEICNRLEFMGKIIDRWEQEYCKGTMNSYFAQPSGGKKTYGEEDMLLMRTLITEGIGSQQRKNGDLKFIHNQLHRVMRIINRMRESARTQRSVKKINIATPIYEALDSLSDSLNKRRIETVTEIPTDLPQVLADEGEMIQIFTNLFRNAMQSIEDRGPPHGMLRVSVSVNGEKIENRIQDNGTGIPVEHQGSIFDSGFTTKSREHGTGLGLGISRRFARECGGDLILEKSIEGEGSCFLLNIPIIHDNKCS